MDIIDGKIQFNYTKSGFTCQNKLLKLPNYKVNEKIIIFAKCEGGDGFKFFKYLHFKNNIKEYCLEKYSYINKTYLSIQVRNTDYKCNYKVLIKNIKMSKYKNIYIATDDKEVINFIKKELNQNNITKNEDINNLTCLTLGR